MNRIWCTAIHCFFVVYRFILSPLLGARCRFVPSCSRYAEQSLIRFGPWRGGFLTVQRLSCCHPWHPGGHDPVPPKTCEVSK